MISDFFINNSLLDLFFYSFIFLLAIYLWSFLRDYYVIKKVLYPMSYLIFTINIIVILSSLIDSSLFTNFYFYTLSIGIISLSLISSDNQAVLNNRIKDIIYKNFTKLSYGDSFFHEKKILNFFLKDFQLGFLFKYINYIYALILFILFAFFSILYIKYELNFIMYFVVSSYILFFVLSISFLTYIERTVYSFDNHLSYILTASSNKKFLNEEVIFEEEPVFYILNIKNKQNLFLFDGGKYSPLYSIINFDFISTKDLEKLFEIVNKKYELEKKTKNLNEYQEL